MIGAPWAIVLCKFKDDQSEPFPRAHYERVFTSIGRGSGNMVDFFADVSHGSVDVGGSQVFGWYTLDRNVADYKGSGINPAGRQEGMDWAKDAARDAGVDLTPFVGVVACMNAPCDLWGGGGQVFTSGQETRPSIMGQEMGHGFGLDHSRLNGSTVDYGDRWDTMSTANAWMAPSAEYGLIGPGLNAWNMRGRGWLDESRVWRSNLSWLDETIDLRPLHRRDLSGFLAAELPSGYLAEFRTTARWDAAIPRPAVLVHRFQANRSYIMPKVGGGLDLGQGDAFQVGSELFPYAPYGRVECVSIDAAAETASVRLVHRGARDLVERPLRRPFWPEELFRGWPEGLPRPGDPLVEDLLGQLRVLAASEILPQPWTRDSVRRDVLERIATQVEAALGDISPFHVPAPLDEQGPGWSPSEHGGGRDDAAR